MANQIIGKTNIHWVDRIVIEIHSLEFESESHKLSVVDVKFYPEDSNHEQFEITAFTNHENLCVKTMEKKRLIKILVDKKEGKSDRRKK